MGALSTLPRVAMTTTDVVRVDAFVLGQALSQCDPRPSLRLGVCVRSSQEERSLTVFDRFGRNANWENRITTV